MDDELRYHIECETAERMRAGQSRDDARRGALQDFGSVERVKEEGRTRAASVPSKTFLPTCVTRFVFCGGTPASPAPRS
jgi:hypothetical protein